MASRVRRILIIGSSCLLGVIVLHPAVTSAPASDPNAAPQQSVAVNPTGQRVSIDVKDTEINRVLEAFSQQTGLSVVSGKDVTGTVTARLVNVDWEAALDAMLKPNGLGYERTGDVIVVMPVARINELGDARPLSSRVYKLKFRDAGDVKPVIEAAFGGRGRVQIVEDTGQKGWDFGAFGKAGSGGGATTGSGTKAAQQRRSYKGAQERRSKSKTLVVSDTPYNLDRVSSIIQEIDTKPQQISIEARFMEVNRDRLKDLGVDYATGSTGASTAAVEIVAADKNRSGDTIFGLGGQVLGSLASPAAFDARSAGINSVNPFNTGASLAFRKLTGTQFDVLVHALEEDINTNTLSAPSIMTLDNQEANILVGTQYPILTSSVAGTTATTTVTSLDYYQDIGIQLRVVPQIAGDNSINMIVHPAVTSFTTTLAAQSPEGTTLAEYPILTTREAETQILMDNGETILIGGLLQDVKTVGRHKVPFLGDIPILGLAFQRRTDDVTKVDLLIFISAKIAGDTDIVATHEPHFVPEQPDPNTQIHWQGEEPEAHWYDSGILAWRLQ